LVIRLEALQDMVGMRSSWKGRTQLYGNRSKEEDTEVQTMRWIPSEIACGKEGGGQYRLYRVRKRVVHGK